MGLRGRVVVDVSLIIVHFTSVGPDCNRQTAHEMRKPQQQGHRAPSEASLQQIRLLYSEGSWERCDCTWASFGRRQKRSAHALLARGLAESHSQQSFAGTDLSSIRAFLSDLIFVNNTTLPRRHSTMRVTLCAFHCD